MEVKFNPPVTKVIQEETIDIIGLTKEQAAVIKGLLGKRNGVGCKKSYTGDIYDELNCVELPKVDILTKCADNNIVFTITIKE